jgi:hypothetical protein
MPYDFDNSNWAEDEIVEMAEMFGVGKYIKFISFDGNGNHLPQSKKYGKYTVAYPDVENYSNGKLILLIEVKSRKEFYKNGGYLAIKSRSFNSYDIVQKNERVPFRVVYLIGNQENYDLYWCNLNDIKNMETHMESFQDLNDDKVFPYIFFHSSQMNTNLIEMFNLI